jgi:hypothetical protein
LTICRRCPAAAMWGAGFQGGYFRNAKSKRRKRCAQDLDRSGRANRFCRA